MLLIFRNINIIAYKYNVTWREKLILAIPQTQVDKIKLCVVVCYISEGSVRRKITHAVWFDRGHLIYKTRYKSKRGH